MKMRERTIIAIIRSVKAYDVVAIAEALHGEGINWLEVSLSDEYNGLACIQQLHTHISSSQIKLGAGTVTTLRQATLAQQAGATYMITPGWDRELVRGIRTMQLDVLPGVYSPGEIMQAQAGGIETVKIFPADHLTTSYIKSLRGPFPHLAFTAVGGVTTENIKSYYQAGYSSFAIGSELVPRGATQADVPLIRERAAQFQEVIAKLGEQA